MNRFSPIPARWAEPRPLFAPPKEGATPVPERKWQSLFDGQTLNGWTIEDNKSVWLVENGAIHCKGGGGGYLRSNKQYENFALACEFMVEKNTNSGVFVRWSNIKDPVNTGIEIQVLDSAGKAIPDKHDSGAIYDLVAPSRNTMKVAGEWNRLAITCQGPNIGVRLNGANVASIDLSLYTKPSKNPDGTPNKFKFAMATLPRRGYFGLQNHGAEGVWYRNLMLMPLPPA